jgi:hypothetical protein
MQMVIRELLRQAFDLLTRYMLTTGMMLADLGKGDSPPPPDYTPVANASEEAARVAAAQADRVLAESKRQYDENMAVARPIVDAQTRIMDETARQGKDYYDYMVSQQRPVERALNDEAMASGTEDKQQEAVDKAIADSQGGYTRALNQGFRQARRYGLSPVATTGSQALQQASNIASAAGMARDKEKMLGYAKKIDVAGLYRGLPGASQGAYATAISSGNSANSNQQSPGNALISSMGTAGNMMITGQGQKLNGLTSVANMQTNAYNTALNNDISGLGGILGLTKMGIDVYTGGRNIAKLS